MSVTPQARTGGLTQQVAEEIRAMMGRRRLSGAALARNLGVSQMWVSDRLAGKTQITIDDLERVAGVLQVSVVDLLPRRSATVTEALPEAHVGSLTRGRPPGRTDRSVRPGGVRRPARLTPPIAA